MKLVLHVIEGPRIPGVETLCGKTLRKPRGSRRPFACTKCLQLQIERHNKAVDALDNLIYTMETVETAMNEAAQQHREIFT